MCHTFFIYSSVEGHLGCFQVLPIANNAAMNIVEQMLLLYDWTSFGYISKSGIAGCWGRLILNFLRNHHIDFQSSCTSLHSHQQWMSVPLTPHPLQHRLSLVFYILAILTGIRWYLRVVLICISLIAKQVEHDLKCLLAIWTSSVEYFLFSSVPHFLFVLISILKSSFLSSLYIWRSDICLMRGWWRSSPIQ